MHSVKCCTFIKYICYHCSAMFVYVFDKSLKMTNNHMKMWKNFVGFFSSLCSDRFIALISCPKFKTFLLTRASKTSNIIILWFIKYFQRYFFSIFGAFRKICNFQIIFHEIQQREKKWKVECFPCFTGGMEMNYISCDGRNFFI